MRLGLHPLDRSFVLNSNSISIEDQSESEVESEQEEVIKPSLFVWEMPPPKTPFMELIFRPSDQVLTHILMEDPAPWNDLTEDISGNPAFPEHPASPPSSPPVTPPSSPPPEPKKFMSSLFGSKKVSKRKRRSWIQKILG